jgi:hypothetical protein
MHRSIALPAALLLLGAGVAAAQTAPPAPPGPASPNSAAQAPCVPGAGNAPTVGSEGSSSNLSDKLASSNGVICPPSGIDPEIHKPAPGGGRMKVIPPPGGPGGDQNLIPK